MKKDVVKLGGVDFVVSDTAYGVLKKHMKDARRASLLRPDLYKDNIEAVRDILMKEGTKTISKKAMSRAIELVGLPSYSSTGTSLKTRFPRTYKVLQRCRGIVVRFGKIIFSAWWKIVLIGIAVLAVCLSAGYGFSAFTSIQSVNQPTGNWNVIDTTIGPVRSYNEPVGQNSNSWLFGWQVALLYAVLLLLVAIVALRLLKPRRVPFILMLAAALFVLGALWQLQRQVTEAETSFRSSWTENTQPLVPRLAYLQQCGDEIPYTFDMRTAGMMFRQFRDEGYELAFEIPTNYGQPDLKLLCVEYDKLRRTHSHENIILQFYTKEADGTIRPYMYSDLSNNTAAYGFFVK